VGSSDRVTAPVMVFQDDADTVVFEPTTRALVAELREGGSDIGYELVPGATHFDLAFGFVPSYEQRTNASIEWIRTRLR
jgi:dipeptidyl aminopeptidase/acylaminoacyl peptidase